MIENISYEDHRLEYPEKNIDQNIPVMNTSDIIEQ